MAAPAGRAVVREELAEEIVQPRQPPRQARAEVTQPHRPVRVRREEVDRETQQRHRPPRPRVAGPRRPDEGFLADEVAGLRFAHRLVADRGRPHEVDRSLHDEGDLARRVARAVERASGRETPHLAGGRGREERPLAESLEGGHLGEAARPVERALARRGAATNEGTQKLGGTVGESHAGRAELGLFGEAGARRGDGFGPARNLFGGERAGGAEESAVGGVGRSVGPQERGLEEISDRFGETLLEKLEATPRRGDARVERVAAPRLVEQAPGLPEVVGLEEEPRDEHRVVAVEGIGPPLVDVPGRDEQARERRRRRGAILGFERLGQPEEHVGLGRQPGRFAVARRGARPLRGRVGHGCSNPDEPIVPPKYRGILSVRRPFGLNHAALHPLC